MAEPADALPEILEVKRTLDGREKHFQCRLIEGAQRQAVVLFVAPAAMHVHGIDLPAGTVTFGHFWTERLYNVYHWLDARSGTIAFYFNLADQTVIEAARLEWRDLTVDVLATPAGRVDVLDEDELPADARPDHARSPRRGEASDPRRPARADGRDRGANAGALSARVSARARPRRWRPMKTVLQRVERAEVRIAGTAVGRIGRGVVLLVGVERGDSETDADVTARKIAALRIFPARTPMDQTLAEVGGACLVVSQFTLAATLAKGNRPSFEPAEAPARAEELYLRVADQLRAAGLPVETGRVRRRHAGRPGQRRAGHVPGVHGGRRTGEVSAHRGG